VRFTRASWVGPICAQADSGTWIGLLRKERGLIVAMLLGRIRLQGNPLLLLRFARCFPT
jgi:putative sterol carrier protein